MPITCWDCLRTSYNENDVANRYCGYCHKTIPLVTCTPLEVMGMQLERWRHESCTADFGVGGDWATLYSIKSEAEGKGHATVLLRTAKTFYLTTGKRVGGTVALNDRMRKIYKRLEITESDGEDDDE